MGVDHSLASVEVGERRRLTAHAPVPHDAARGCCDDRSAIARGRRRPQSFPGVHPAPNFPRGPIPTQQLSPDLGVGSAGSVRMAPPSGSVPPAPRPGIFGLAAGLADNRHACESIVPSLAGAAAPTWLDDAEVNLERQQRPPSHPDGRSRSFYNLIETCCTGSGSFSSRLILATTL